MTDRSTDQLETGIAAQNDGAVPVLITFALLFLLSAAVWFVLDRIRAEELRGETVSHSSPERGATTTGAKVETSSVAAK